MKFSMLTGLTTACVLTFAPATARDVTGAGATFPYPIYAKWADAYKKETGSNLNYQSIGSGAGVKQITAGTVTFGASDFPLKPEQLKKDGLVQWPQIIGAIVVVVNIEGVAPGRLVLDGSTIADIFLGKITKWNDPSIVKLNPDLKPPSADITVVRRADGSGTTFNFTDYLSKVSADWKTKAGVGAAIEWPVGVGAKGNEGVAANVAQTKNAIGYVEYAYAKQNKMTYADMVNKSGKRVTPSPRAFQAAAANADWSEASGFYQILTDQPGDESWPIVAGSFILMHAEPKDKESSAEALKFFDWAFKNGDKMASDLDYITIPPTVVETIRASWKRTIKNN